MTKHGILFTLLGMVVISVLSLGAVGLFGTINSRKIKDSLDRIQFTAEEFQEFALRVNGPLNDLRQLSLTMVMAPTQELKQSLDLQQKELTAQLDTVLQGWDLIALRSDQRQAFETLKDSWKRYKDIKDHTVRNVMQGYREEAFINAIGAEDEQFKRVNQHVDSWQSAMSQQAAQLNQEASDVYQRGRWISTVLFASMGVLITGVGVAAIRIIVIPINALRRAANVISADVSEESLTLALDFAQQVERSDEVGTLALAFQQMLISLKSAIEQLSVEERRTQAILDSTADGIVTVDERGLVRSFNESAESLLGYKASEVMGNDVSGIVPALGNDHEWEDDKLDVGETRRIGGQNEVTGIDRDGRHIPLALRVTEMEYLGERLYIGTLQDVSEQKRMEQERADIARAVRDAVSRLVKASDEIMKIARHQGEGAQQQASAISQISTTVAEVAQTAEHAADNADAVEEAARRANESGRAGREAVERSIQMMTTVKQQVESIADTILNLAERAQAIGDITETVGHIADQTNVLALNAAVEAARAGEQGKGFAVVAGEVKSLSEQSKRATAQVRQILSEIQQATNNAVMSTEQGTTSVKESNEVSLQTGEVIHSLSEVLNESAMKAQQISTNVRQQSEGVLHLHASIKDIENVTQHNLSAIRQIESSVQNLISLSNELASLTTDRM